MNTRIIACIIISLLSLLYTCRSSAQSTYRDSIVEYQKQYLKDIVVDAGGPLKPAQTKNISFYQPNPAYRVWADFKETPGAVPFMISTHSGKNKPYKEYGTVTFYIHDTMLVLHTYQSLDLLKRPGYENHLFIPFKDMTNYDATYGGGRYIDLKTSDIHNGRMLIDFNKAYNPYCAYADGYSCPIPPDENHLKIEIPAGEKMFIQ